MTVAEIHRLVAEQIPLAQTLRLQLEEVSSGHARLHLRATPELLNHGGSLHAGAIFSAAETCALALGYMLLPTAEVQCQTKVGEMRFRKPARSDLWAVAQRAPAADSSRAISADELLARLTAEGKIDVSILVSLSDQADERIAEGTIILTLRRL